MDPTIKYHKVTICEMHRRIYRKLMNGGSFEDVKYLLEDAFDVGKKLSWRLRQYKNNYDETWYMDAKEYDKTRVDQEEEIPWKEEIEINHPIMGKSKVKM
jgi:hypothetical protein